MQSTGAPSARRTRRSSVTAVDDILAAGIRGDTVSMINDGNEAEAEAPRRTRRQSIIRDLETEMQTGHGRRHSADTSSAKSTANQGKADAPQKARRQSQSLSRDLEEEMQGILGKRNSTGSRSSALSGSDDRGVIKDQTEVKETARQETDRFSEAEMHRILGGRHSTGSTSSKSSGNEGRESSQTNENSRVSEERPQDKTSISNDSEDQESSDESCSKRFGNDVVVNVAVGKAEAARRRGSVTFENDNSSHDSADSEPEVAPPFVSGKRKKDITTPKRHLLEAAAQEDANLTGEEFLQLDYTPCVNTRPMDLSEQLRCVRLGRHIRVMICVTAYTEKGEEVKQTLQGLAKNMNVLTDHGVHWQDIAVVLVADGREKVDKSLLDYMDNELGVYDPQLTQEKVGDQPVTMHLYEKTVRMSKHETRREYFQPVQLIFALKERNGGKLNSHLWFFTGFCEQVQPKFTFLFDVGTVPRDDAVYQLYKLMERDPNVGGCCGEIAVRDLRYYQFLQAAQHFEYKVAHVLDKAMESFVGYITVLPGAFSAYRLDAIRGNPLKKYFTVEEKSLKELGPFQANMFLAEDRVLSFEILAQENENWTLRYEPRAIAYTDVPLGLQELIKQRRRWLNGSFFALLYYLWHFKRYMKNSHGVFRKLMLMVQFGFATTTVLISWLYPGSLYLSFAVIFWSAFRLSGFGISGELFHTFSFSYLCIIYVLMTAALVGNVGELRNFYISIAAIFAAFIILSILFAIWLFTQFIFDTVVLVGVLAGFGIYAFAAIMHRQVWSILGTLFQYLTLLPTFVTMFPIFSFCNLHDISWGTKEGNLTAEMQRGLEIMAQREAEKALKVQDTIQQMTAVNKQAHEQRGLDKEEERRSARSSLKNSVEEEDDEEPDSEEEEIMMEANRVQRAHAAAARKAQERAQAMLQEKKEAAQIFNYFRLRLLCMWMLSNALWVLVILYYQLLPLYPLWVAAAIIYTGGFKLIGSFLFLFTRFIERILRTRCGCCYKRDPITGKRYCCCRSKRYFRKDHMWLLEHGLIDIDMETGNWLPSAELQRRQNAGYSGFEDEDMQRQSSDSENELEESDNSSDSSSDSEMQRKNGHRKPQGAGVYKLPPEATMESSSMDSDNGIQGTLNSKETLHYLANLNDEGLQGNMATETSKRHQTFGRNAKTQQQTVQSGISLDEEVFNRSKSRGGFQASSAGGGPPRGPSNGQYPLQQNHVYNVHQNYLYPPYQSTSPYPLAKGNYPSYSSMGTYDTYSRGGPSPYGIRPGGHDPSVYYDTAGNAINSPRQPSFSTGRAEWGGSIDRANQNLLSNIGSNVKRSGSGSGSSSGDESGSESSSSIGSIVRKQSTSNGSFSSSASSSSSSIDAFSPEARDNHRLNVGSTAVVDQNVVVQQRQGNNVSQNSPNFPFARGNSSEKLPASLEPTTQKNVQSGGSPQNQTPRITKDGTIPQNHRWQTDSKGGVSKDLTTSRGPTEQATIQSDTSSQKQVPGRTRGSTTPQSPRRPTNSRADISKKLAINRGPTEQVTIQSDTSPQKQAPGTTKGTVSQNHRRKGSVSKDVTTSRGPTEQVAIQSETSQKQTPGMTKDGAVPRSHRRSTDSPGNISKKLATNRGPTEQGTIQPETSPQKQVPGTTRDGTFPHNHTQPSDASGDISKDSHGATRHGKAQSGNFPQGMTRDDTLLQEYTGQFSDSKDLQSVEGSHKIHVGMTGGEHGEDETRAPARMHTAGLSGSKQSDGWGWGKIKRMFSEDTMTSGEEGKEILEYARKHNSGRVYKDIVDEGDVTDNGQTNVVAVETLTAEEPVNLQQLHSWAQGDFGWTNAGKIVPSESSAKGLPRRNSSRKSLNAELRSLIENQKRSEGHNQKLLERGYSDVGNQMTARNRTTSWRSNRQTQIQKKKHAASALNVKQGMNNKGSHVRADEDPIAKAAREKLLKRQAEEKNKKVWRPSYNHNPNDEKIRKVRGANHSQFIQIAQGKLKPPVPKQVPQGPTDRKQEHLEKIGETSSSDDDDTRTQYSDAREVGHEDFIFR